MMDTAFEGLSHEFCAEVVPGCEGANVRELMGGSFKEVKSQPPPKEAMVGPGKQVRVLVGKTFEEGVRRIQGEANIATKCTSLLLLGL